MSCLWLGPASWPRGCLGFIPVDVLTALTDDSQQPLSSLLLFLGKHQRVKLLGFGMMGSEFISGMKTSTQREP